MRLVLTNASTLCSDSDLATVASAVSQQLRDVAGAWDRQEPSVDFIPASDYGTANFDVGIVVLDDADQAGALGYHATDPNGQPYARVFARDSIAGLTGLDPASLNGEQPSGFTLSFVAPVISHEAVEAFLDAPADEWADDGNGTAVALEGADPCESSLYATQVDGQQVSLSDYVLPAYFDQGASGPYDRLGQISGPFGLASGGYQIVESEGNVQAVFGDGLAAWRATQHAEAEKDARSGADTARRASRTAQRFTKACARTARTEEAPVMSTTPPDPAPVADPVTPTDLTGAVPEVAPGNPEPVAPADPVAPAPVTVAEPAPAVEQPETIAATAPQGDTPNVPDAGSPADAETDPPVAPFQPADVLPGGAEPPAGDGVTPEGPADNMQPGNESTADQPDALLGVAYPSPVQPGQALVEQDNTDPDHPVTRILPQP